MLLIYSCLIKGQNLDLDNIGKQKPIKVSGGISMLNRFYNGFGIEDRQDNFLWTLSGRLNFSVFGIAIPLSGTLTSQNSSITQPYNRLAIKPTYKWARAHIGYSNMTYSTYTLAGHTFLGGGLELNPGKLRFAANYGRFATAIPLDMAVNQPFVPSFDRFGYGGKIGYGDDSNFIDFTFFTAEDKQDSWDVIPDSTTVFPGANMVLGTTWKLSLIKNLSLTGEFARTAFTTDMRDEEVDTEAPFKWFGFNSVSSTILRNAMKFSASYNLASLGSTVSGTYERIDPGYQTMGAYFFNNDMENITVAVSTSFLNKKVILSVNGGFQRNNLFGTEQSESIRTISAGNIVYSNSPFSLGVNYSNYSAEVRYVLNQDLDSLNAVVVTESIGGFGTYSFQTGGGNSQVISVNLTQQSVGDDFESEARSSDNTMLTGTLNYTLKLKDSGLDLSARMNYNRNDLAGVVSERLGPGVSARRTFFKELIAGQASVNYFTSEGNQTLTLLLTGSATLNSKHTISLNSSFIQRTIESASNLESTSATTSYGELTATLNYSYQF